MVEVRCWRRKYENLEYHFPLIYLLSFPEIVNNDVDNDVDAGADDEEEEPQINNLEKENLDNLTGYTLPNIP